MKHRKVETTSEYYNAIPTRFKLQAKIVLEQWAKDFIAPDNEMSFAEFINQIVPHFYECWRIIINAQAKKHAAPPQPVPIQLDTWSLRTGDALDPAKRCEPPEFKYGRWWPMECPDNDVVYQ